MAAVQELRARAETGNRPLTAELATQIVAGAFFLSQGDDPFLAEILRNVRSIRPNWRISDELRDQVERDVFDIAKKRVRADLHLRKDDTTLHEGAHKGAEFLQTVFNDNPTEGDSMPDQRISLARGMIAGDAHYLLDPDKLRWRNFQKLEPPQDSHLSQFAWFVLAGHNMGIPEYDELFAEMRNAVRSTSEAELNEKLDEVAMNNLRGIIRVHNSSHPDDQVSLPIDE